MTHVYSWPCSVCSPARVSLSCICSVVSTAVVHNASQVIAVIGLNCYWHFFLHVEATKSHIVIVNPVLHVYSVD